MSDTAAESSQPTSPKSHKSSSSAVIWLIILIVAAVAFAATVVWSGGFNETLKLVGLDSLFSASSPPPAPSQGNEPVGAPVGSVATSGAALPASASEDMYREQLQSQESIADLVNDKIATLSLGTPDVSAKVATVPVRVGYRNGSTASGVMTLKKYDDLWYFFSITADGSKPDSSESDVAIDPAVVDVITEQQATAANQEMIVDGLLGGGYKAVRVKSVSEGSGTAKVNVELSGGSEPTSAGEFLCIQKADGTSDYWFITKFSEK